jgi:hypothetical protein
MCIPSRSKEKVNCVVESVHNRYGQTHKLVDIIEANIICSALSERHLENYEIRFILYSTYFIDCLQLCLQNPVHGKLVSRGQRCFCHFFFFA